MPPKKETDASQMAVGQPADILFNDGTVGIAQSIEPVTSDQLQKDYLDALAFMEDEMIIVVQETTDRNAENPVRVGVNGVFAQFDRGKPTRTKRKFVNNLCVKSGDVTTPEYINGAGERAFKIVQRQAMKFPFMVIKDPSPKGTEWLTRRLAEVV